MVHMYIHHFGTLDQRDSPVYISHISLWLGDMISPWPQEDIQIPDPYAFSDAKEQC